MAIKYANKDLLAIVISHWKSVKISLQLKALILIFNGFKSARRFILSFLLLAAICFKLLIVLVIKEDEIAAEKNQEKRGQVTIILKYLNQGGKLPCNNREMSIAARTLTPESSYSTELECHASHSTHFSRVYHS